MTQVLTLGEAGSHRSPPGKEVWAPWRIKDPLWPPWAVEGRLVRDASRKPVQGYVSGI